MDEMKQLAPIVLFVYNRIDHTKLTIKALQDNTLAKDSELYIYSDGPKNDSVDMSIVNLRAYLKSIDGFKNVNIIERKENYGLARNIIEGVTDIINKHGKVIVLEDDLLTSQNFLCYMNSALEYYQTRNDIFSVSGYTGVLPSLTKFNYTFDSYLSYRPSSWGWATWKYQWENIDWDVSDFEEFIQNKKEVKKFNRGGIDMARMLKSYINNKNNSWAIRWSYAMYKKDKYCVYPKLSKVQNIGFGIEATHCSNIDIYQTTLDNSKRCEFNFTDEIIPDTQLAKEFRYKFSYTNKLLKKTSGYIKKVLK